MASKNQVISEYKTICSQLSAKLEKAQANVKANDNGKKENDNQQVKRILKLSNHAIYNSENSK